MLKSCAERLIKMGDIHLLAAVYYDLGFLKIQEDKHEEALEYFDLSFKTDDIEKMRLLCTCSAYTSQLGQLIR